MLVTSRQPYRTSCGWPPYVRHEPLQSLPNGWRPGPRWDRGIIPFRKMLSEQIDLVEQGGDPLGLIWDPTQNECVTFDDETEWARWERRAQETKRQEVLDILQAGISFRQGYV